MAKKQTYRKYKKTAISATTKKKWKKHIKTPSNKAWAKSGFGKRR